jgi:hypothetical protein
VPPVIPATQDAEIRRIKFQSQPRKIVSEALSQKKTIMEKKGWWSSDREALSPNSSAGKKEPVFLGVVCFSLFISPWAGVEPRPSHSVLHSLCNTALLTILLTQSHCVAQADLELVVLLPQCWDYRCAPLGLALIHSYTVYF